MSVCLRRLFFFSFLTLLQLSLSLILNLSTNFLVQLVLCKTRKLFEMINISFVSNEKRFVYFFFLSGKFSAREGIVVSKSLSEPMSRIWNLLEMKISAEDIYTVNHESLKDATVQFGSCAGGIISNQSLLLTNHHCGFSQPSLSAAFREELSPGWLPAKSMNEEIPCPGINGYIHQNWKMLVLKSFHFFSLIILSEEQRKTIWKSVR